MSANVECLADENLLLYINLAGELFYIIAHRMRSQVIESEVQLTVFSQLILAICSPEHILELSEGQLKFIGQPFEVARGIMKDLVDSTIMKINDYSMQKLFELTLIATKYQYTVCVHSPDILLIALNHLDTIRIYAKETKGIELLTALHNLLIESYEFKSQHEMKTFRLSILDYVKDLRLKMTNLVSLGLQDSNGDFIRRSPDKSEYPVEGTLVYTYEEDDIPSEGNETFDFCQWDKRQRQRRMHSYNLHGDRVISLGRSIYDIEPKYPTSNIKEYEDLNNSKMDDPDSFEAIQGLEHCKSLLGATETSQISKTEKDVYTFPTIGRCDSTQTIRIDARLDRTESKLRLLDIATQFDESITKNKIGNNEKCSTSSVSELMESLIIDDGDDN